jgi:hypothetical protein
MFTTLNHKYRQTTWKKIAILPQPQKALPVLFPPSFQPLGPYTPPIFCLHARLVNLVTVAFSYPNRPFVACWEQQGYASQSHNTRRSLRSNRTRISMADAPQVAYAGAYPEVHNETPPSKHHEVYNDTVPSKHHGPPSQDIRAYHHPEENSIQKPRRTILGMRRRNFWILLAIALVIVAATIGGSVGGSMAVRNSRYNCH